MSDNAPQVNFDAAAQLYKWPSLGNSRREDRMPYVVFDGTLDGCMKAFMAKPEKTRHLYEIRTSPQAAVVTPTLSAEHILELARLRDFL